MEAQEYKEIACQQVLMEDGSVFSIQWLVLPPECADALFPAALLERYLAFIRRFTLSIVRAVRTGRGIEFRLFGLSLLGFGVPEFIGGRRGRSAVLRISGGVLAGRGQRDRGEFVFTSEPVETGVRVTLRLSGYHPRLLGTGEPCRLRKRLYRFTQAYIHRLVTVRFLACLYRELAGKDACIRVVSVREWSGEEI